MLLRVILACAPLVCALALAPRALAENPSFQQPGTPLPAAPGPDQQRLAELTKAVEAGLFPKTTSILVLYRGHLVYEHYFGSGSAEQLNDVRSETKIVTGLAVGVAIHDGAIAGRNAPAFNYVADMAPFRNDTPLKHAITIEDLLTMSSALDCNDNVDDSPGNEDRMHEQAAWLRWVVDLPTQSNYRRDAGGRGPFAYCTANAFLLGQIVQRATRMPVDQYIAEKIFAPLGISKWQWPRSPAGAVMTGGGLRLRSRDIAALAMLIMQEGKWNGASIVPASWIAATLTPYRVASPEQTYGYLSYQRRYATNCGRAEAGLMAGNGGSVVVLLKSLAAAVVVTRQNYNVKGTAQQSIDLVEKFILPALPCGA